MMKNPRPNLLLSLFFAAVLTFVHVGSALAGGGHLYQVTVTNLTRGQNFTPILAVSHQPDMKLFMAGQPASEELAQLAEGGDTGPLSELLLNSPRVSDVATSGDVLAPGASTTIFLEAGKRFKRLSLASMLVPTNDAFWALNAVELPRGHRSQTFMAVAYDAGSEMNDELCAHIPGPPFVCSGEGFNPAGGEGFVHVHSGIHGSGDLPAGDHDWRNPVARVTITKARSLD